MLCYALTFTASHQFVYQTIIVVFLEKYYLSCPCTLSTILEASSILPVRQLAILDPLLKNAREIRDGFVPVILSGMLELEAFRRQIKRKSGPPT